MKKFWFVLSSVLFLSLASVMTSCSESEEDEGMYDLTTSSDFAILAEALEKEDGNYAESSEAECFTVTFPITLNNPDGTTTEITTEGDLDSYYEQWEDEYEDNGTIPSLVYPIEVTLADGTVMSINDDTALRDLLATCYSEEGEEEDDEEDDDDEDEMSDAEEFAIFLSCYDFVLPVDMANDSTTVTATTIEEVTALYTQEGEDEYEFVFPIDLIDLADNSTITVATEEELDDLEDKCEDSQG